MLQQTRVNAMLPLYERFMEIFPSVESLASSSEESVLENWRGLGYYARARNLRKAAIFLVQNFNGKFPKDLNLALQIPGIGPYTARAVLSIAYDLPYAVLDGNVKRVLSRLFKFETNILSASADKELQILADSFLNLNSPGDHNQAMMELGANLCLPENPKCLLCPFLNFCEANRLGLTDKIPIRFKQEKKIELVSKMFCVRKENLVLLVKEKQTRFLKGMYHLPFGFFDEGLEKKYHPSSFLHFLNSLTYSKFESKFTHSITHHKLKFELYVTEADIDFKLKAFADDLEYKWIPVSDLEKEFPSSLASKAKKIMHTSF